jgi:hypothetical protein
MMHFTDLLLLERGFFSEIGTQSEYFRFNEWILVTAWFERLHFKALNFFYRNNYVLYAHCLIYLPGFS